MLLRNWSLDQDPASSVNSGSIALPCSKMTGVCKCAVLVLALVTCSLAHRDGARNNESCYDHDVIHMMAGVPPSRKIDCTLACNYDLNFHGWYNKTTRVLLDSDPEQTLICGEVYQCEFKYSFGMMP